MNESKNAVIQKSSGTAKVSGVGASVTTSGAGGNDIIFKPGNKKPIKPVKGTIGFGFKLPIAVFNGVVASLKKSNILFDEDDPRSITQALNVLRQNERKELVKDVAKESGTEVDFETLLSDFQDVLDSYDTATREFSKYAEAQAEIINTNRENLLGDIWNSDKYTADQANDQLAAWTRDNMNTDVGTRPGTGRPTLQKPDTDSEPGSTKPTPVPNPINPTLQQAPFDYGPGGIQQWIADWFTETFWIPADPPGSGPPTYTHPSYSEIVTAFMGNWGQPGFNGQSLAHMLAANWNPSALMQSATAPDGSGSTPTPQQANNVPTPYMGDQRSGDADDPLEPIYNPGEWPGIPYRPAWPFAFPDDMPDPEGPQPEIPNIPMMPGKPNVPLPWRPMPPGTVDPEMKPWRPDIIRPNIPGYDPDKYTPDPFGHEPFDPSIPGIPDWPLPNVSRPFGTPMVFPKDRNQNRNLPPGQKPYDPTQPWNIPGKPATSPIPPWAVPKPGEPGGPAGPPEPKPEKPDPSSPENFPLDPTIPLPPDFLRGPDVDDPTPWLDNPVLPDWMNPGRFPRPGDGTLAMANAQRSGQDDNPFTEPWHDQPQDIPPQVQPPPPGWKPIDPRDFSDIPWYEYPGRYRPDGFGDGHGESDDWMDPKGNPIPGWVDDPYDFNPPAPDDWYPGPDGRPDGPAGRPEDPSWHLDPGSGQPRPGRHPGPMGRKPGPDWGMTPQGQPYVRTPLPTPKPSPETDPPRPMGRPLWDMMPDWMKPSGGSERSGERSNPNIQKLRATPTLSGITPYMQQAPSLSKPYPWSDRPGGNGDKPDDKPEMGPDSPTELPWWRKLPDSAFVDTRKKKKKKKLTR